MISARTVVDASGLYRVAQGFTAIETDRDVLSLEDLHLVWGKGGRAANAIQRLAKARDIECLSLDAPSTWFTAIRLPESVVEREGHNVKQFFVDEPPVTEGDARDCVRLWVASSQYAFVLALLEDPDRLLETFAGDQLDSFSRELLLWLAKSRGELRYSGFVLKLVEADDPVAEWFGLRETDGTAWINHAAGFLPSKLPPQIVSRIQNHWREVLIRGRFDVVAQALSRALPKTLSAPIKRVSTDVYEHLSPRQQAAVEADARVIFGPKWKPSKPAEMRWAPLVGSETVSDMLDWFRGYRAELSWRMGLLAERVKAAQSFREWYLDRERFPRWCAEGEAGQLSFRVNSIIRDAQHSHSAVLAVIVDGLGHEEHLRLLDYIGQRTVTLYVHIDFPVLSVLPTITPICKGALLSGRPQRERPNIQPDYPRMVRDCARVNFRGRYLESWDSTRIAAWLKDTDTSLIVVNHLELDKELHRCRSGPEAEARIESALTYIASSIANLVDEMEGELDSLALIVCSDHGQVVGPCRAVAPPSGVVKQRLRLAASDKRTNEKELPGSMTLCTEDYLFVDDDSAWCDDEGEVFGCHGGVFPEEVVTRVTLLSTIANVPQVKVAGEGKGVAGVAGDLTWSVTNASRIELSVVRATLKFGSQAIPLQPLAREVPANAQRNSPAENVKDWPTQEQAPEALLEIEYVVAGKDTPLTVSGPVRLDITLGYESSVFSL